MIVGHGDMNAAIAMVFDNISYEDFFRMAEIDYCQQNIFYLDKNEQAVKIPSVDPVRFGEGESFG